MNKTKKFDLKYVWVIALTITFGPYKLNDTVFSKPLQTKKKHQIFLSIVDVLGVINVGGHVRLLGLILKESSFFDIGTCLSKGSMPKFSYHCVLVGNEHVVAVGILNRKQKIK